MHMARLYSPSVARAVVERYVVDNLFVDRHSNSSRGGSIDIHRRPNLESTKGPVAQRHSCSAVVESAMHAHARCHGGERFS